MADRPNRPMYSPTPSPNPIARPGETCAACGSPSGHWASCGQRLDVAEARNRLGDRMEHIAAEVRDGAVESLDHNWRRERADGSSFEVFAIAWANGDRGRVTIERYEARLPGRPGAR